MTDPAFIALASSLGPVAYVMGGFLTINVVSRLFDNYRPRDTFDYMGVGVLFLCWPITAVVVLLAGLGRVADWLGK
jgi:hypothetical protein